MQRLIENPETLGWFMFVLTNVLPSLLLIGSFLVAVILVTSWLKSHLEEKAEQREIIKDGRLSRLKHKEAHKTQVFRNNLDQKQLTDGNPIYGEVVDKKSYSWK